MTKPYDEQAGFRKKTGEKDFKIRRVGGRSQPAAEPARDSGWTLLDQVAGKTPTVAVEPEPPAAAPAAFASAAPAPVAAASTAVPAATRPVAAGTAAPEPVAARPRFRSLLSGQPEHATEAVSGAYNGTPLKALLRRIAERQAMNRPSGFDEWR
ncbi:hypothetical protein ACLD0W_10895 [Alloalcanivorax sp. C16-1]|uniref:hypothetical protein n=1 Tax=Alloalcanivorax sp. C16-1 TaxID=3390051 RepID=UPI00397104CC